MLLTAVFIAGFAAAAVAPFALRRAGAAAGWMASVVPLLLSVVLVLFAADAAGGAPRAVSWPWAATFGLELSLRLDALGLLFGLLVTVVGAFVCVYAGGYLREHHQAQRFFAWLLLFMAAMLGVTLADNLLLLYVCWELTSVSSWLLIGFEHREESSRKAAWQALVVTGSGGLALLAGFVLLGQETGSYRLSTILEQGEAIRASASYPAILALVLVGAATKSALVPFHVWLPNAMAAPTPVSAYLHSATMVKAGVFLLARVSPALAGTQAWTIALGSLGATTALFGGWMAFVQRDAKRLLAYSTISTLGLIALGLGLGGSAAVHGALALVLAHALYKGALFLTVGAVDHAAGTRELDRLGGLWRAMPWTAAAGLLATASMVALPPTLGYVGEDALLKAMSEKGSAGGRVWLVAAGVALALYAAAGFVVGLRPFLGRARWPGELHGISPLLVGPPLLLAAAGCAAGLFPRTVDAWLVAPATAAVAGARPEESLALWHGLTVAFAVGAASTLVGAALAWGWRPLRARARRLAGIARVGPDRGYALLERGLLAGAERLDRFVQHGYLPAYLLVVLATVLALVGPPLLATGIALPEALTPVRVFDVFVLGATVAAAIGAAWSRSRVAVIACMSLVGAGVALLFATFGGADLAMTQVLVDTLLAVFAVLVLPALPRFGELSRRGMRVLVTAVAGAMGVTVAALLLAASSTPAPARELGAFYARHAKEAGGGNVVNTILVNFRAIDTLVEIGVLAAGALGVAVLMAGEPHTPRGGARGHLARLESLLLSLAARAILPLLLLFALYLLAGGHHQPGGGFAAALVLTSALALYLLGNPRAAERNLLGVGPRRLLALGLLVVSLSGLPGLLGGEPFLSAAWIPGELDVLGGLRFGTPLLFDLGVCLTAAGGLFLVLRELEERGPWSS